MHILHRTDGKGSSIEILPFLSDSQIQICADPPIYVVGHRNENGFGEVPLADWEDILGDSGISLRVIAKVRMYFGMHEPVNYKEVDDD